MNIKGKKLIPKFVQWQLEHRPFPRTLLTMGKGHPIYAKTLRAQPMEHQEEEIMPPLMDAQQKLLERGEATSTLVDLALIALHNPFLQGEVNAY